MEEPQIDGAYAPRGDGEASTARDVPDAEGSTDPDTSNEEELVADADNKNVEDADDDGDTDSTPWNRARDASPPEEAPPAPLPPMRLVRARSAPLSLIPRAAYPVSLCSFLLFIRITWYSS